MSLKVKAKEREFKVGKYAGEYRYVMVPEMYSALAKEKVIREAALRSGVSEGVMHACWDAAGEVIKAWATEGHSVALPGLGTMRFSLSAKSVADVNKVKADLITTRRIVFTPAVELKDELKNTSVIITCYDRNGNVVKRVTSADDGTVEEPDNTTETGENDGGNSGSTSESVDSPTISGNTSFADTTQVSMSGPTGAEIHYTTNGSDPTTESPVYSEAFTLSETTTVKAIAIKDGVASQVVTKYFTKNSGGNGDGNMD
ncbi:MAG: chitobiase/beta-hexosaminidase C-terminal domain-containing protein [Prevotella sp.]|nr:chitobiase/beta-hexosaminidase C-terminal domain-containing protein [Prevotella sp.]